MALFQDHFIDTLRPGMGGSTPVPLSIRMKVWLETVPALLKEVDVQHISLLCHSAGTIYGLNTIYYLRHILDPERPYTAMIGEQLTIRQRNDADILSPMGPQRALFSDVDELCVQIAERDT